MRTPVFGGLTLNGGTTHIEAIRAPMTEKLDGNQGDLFPKLLQDESLRVERHVAEKKLRDRRALPDRINGYWHGFYQRKLVAWTLDAELKKQYSFDYRFCPDGELTLLFYYPTLSEIGLSESGTSRSSESHRTA